MRGPQLIGVDEIEQKLRDRVLDLCVRLLPNGRRDGHFWTVGGIDGRPGNSLKVKLSGANVGLWCDYVDPRGPDMKGDCLHLIRLSPESGCGGDLGAAVKWAKAYLGIEGMAPEQLARERIDTRALAAKRQAEEEQENAAKMLGAKKLWHHPGAVAIAGTPAEAYLVGRGITLARLGKWPGSLKYHPEVWNAEARCKIPAMLAMGVTPEGKHVATHRTFLQNCPRRGWTKIDSPNAKMVLGKIGGAFIPLRKGSSGKSMANMPAGEPMLLTEGIEDGLTVAMARPDARIGAGYSLPNLGAIVFPEQMGPLVLAADRDSNVKAVEALERAIARQQSRGVRVKLAMPPVGIKDFNEWLNAGGAAEGVAA